MQDIKEEKFTLDLFLNGRIKAWQPSKGHRSGTDAVLLAAYSPVNEADRVAEIGSGVGVAGLCLQARVKISKLTFIEINAELCELALKNAPFAEVINLDIRQRARLPSAQFDQVIFNPPYNPPSLQMSMNDEKRLAHEGLFFEEWIKTSAHLLHAKGSVTFIDRPERLSENLKALERSFGAIEILPVFTGRETATRLLFRAKKGVKTPLSILPPFDLVKNSEKILRYGEKLP